MEEHQSEGEARQKSDDVVGQQEVVWGRPHPGAAAGVATERFPEIALRNENPGLIPEQTAVGMQYTTQVTVELQGKWTI